MIRWLLIAAALLLLFLLALYPLAHAHDSWISRQRITDPASGEWCCNMIDCRVED